INCFFWSQSENCIGQHRAETIEDSIVKHANAKNIQVLYGGIENWLHDFNETVNNSNRDRISQIKHIMASKSIITESQTAPRIQQGINDYVLSIIKQYPETQFHLILPTFSRLGYKTLFNGKEPYVVLTWLVSEIEKLPNAKLYGFDDLDYADHIENYWDIYHYNIDMNSMQLDAIRDDTHILTPHNIEEYLNTMRRKIDEYDPKPIIKTIEATLQKMGIELERLQD
ncbi:MAG: hypothetical protein K2N70_08340, partial [Helicobacter sp.]|nr:hypothetical protein [Helicobacter sp.]